MKQVCSVISQVCCIRAHCPNHSTNWLFGKNNYLSPALHTSYFQKISLKPQYNCILRVFSTELFLSMIVQYLLLSFCEHIGLSDLNLVMFIRLIGDNNKVIRRSSNRKSHCNPADKMFVKDKIHEQFYQISGSRLMQLQFACVPRHLQPIH